MQTEEDIDIALPTWVKKLRKAYLEEEGITDEPNSYKNQGPSEEKTKPRLKVAEQELLV